ncbi:unnamed protein product [Rhizophagus irregularis]|nr:unnamed protein product [Rhizophagus irregularis]
MPVQLPLIPIIPIDSDEARNVEVTSTLCRIFYQPSGYQRTAKKLYETSQNAGYDFTLDEVQDWLERQAVYQVHKPHPRFIPCVSFSSIQVPNEVHQADILYMPYDKVYDDTTCPLTWPKLLITDRGSEFKGECEKLMTSHGVKIQKTKSKRTVGIVERYNRTLVEKLFPSQDASDLLTLAIKKSRVSSRSSYPHDGSVGYEEEKLPPDISKNQPVLYWLIDDDGKESERSFVREELLVIPDDTELPPQWVLMN